MTTDVTCLKTYWNPIFECARQLQSLFTWKLLLSTRFLGPIFVVVLLIEGPCIMLQSFKVAVCSVWKCGIFIMDGLGLGWSFCVPVFCRTQWMTMEQHWQNWSVCLDGRSVDPAAFQRPWGPAAIISHSFCPLPLSPAPALYTNDGLSVHSQKDTTKRLHREALYSPNIEYTHKCTQQTYSYAVLFCYFLSLSLFMWPYLFSHSFQVYFGLVSEWGGVLEKWWAVHCEGDWSDVQRRLDWCTADGGRVKHMQNPY